MSDLSGRKIVLVGGAGFIGHNLALDLKKRGASVFIIDSLAINNFYSLMSQPDELPYKALYQKIIQERLDLIKDAEIPLLIEDSRHYVTLGRIIAKLDPDTIVHLAAVAHAGRSNKDPYSTFDHSLRTLENSLDIARSSELNVKHFVYFSSSMVYGNFDQESVTEESICNPIGIYGALKFAGEKLVIAYNQVFDLDYTIIRPSALYGERCVSRRVSQIFIENLIQNTEINIMGEGEDRLDFTYIDDLVSGIVQVLTQEKARNQCFNLTFGESRSLADMVEILAQMFPNIKVKYQPKDKLMPKRGTLCVDKAKELIGYAPKNDLITALPKYVNWYRRLWADYTS
jgi:nucleoside-diphosphate-sugar epimerase